MPKSVLFDKEKTIQRVTELFWEKGYNGTSMQDLVDVTGLNRSSIYNTYGDKFSLFTQALHHYKNSQTDFLNSLKNRAKSPKEVINLLFEGVWSELNPQNNKGCFLSNCTTELANANKDVHEFLEVNHEMMISLFTELIKQAQIEGEIDKSKDSKVLANFLFSSLHGLRVTSMIETDKKAIKGIADQVLSALN